MLTLDEKRERMKLILAAAERMCGEIVWADFPTLSVKGLDKLMTSLCQEDANIDAIRLLCQFSAALDDAIDLVDDREIEHQGASLIQAAVKWLARNWLKSNNLGPLAALLRAEPIRMKFETIDLPTLQAPVGAIVPSIGEQRARRRAGLSGIESAN